jgi:hypothetical protein
LSTTLLLLRTLFGQAIPGHYTELRDFSISLRMAVK